MSAGTDIKRWQQRLNTAGVFPTSLSSYKGHQAREYARDAEIAELRAALAATEHRAWCAEVNEDGAREHLAEVQKAVSLPVGAVVALPADIYYCAEHDNFYCAKKSAGMGQAFYEKWFSDRAKFPVSVGAALASQPAKPADVGGVVEGLLPCPFCGAKPLLQEHEPHTHSGPLKTMGIPDHPGSFTIECPTEGCCGMIDNGKADVTASWNRRAALAAQTAAPGAKEVRYLLKNALPVLKQHYRSLAVEVESYLASPQPVDGAAGVKPEGFKLRTSQGPLFCEQEPSVDRDLWVALYTAAPAPAAPVDLSDGADSCTVGCLRRDI